MYEWLRVAPEVLLAIGFLGLPGLVLALCLRFRWWDAVGLSAPLSLGVLGIAIEVSNYGKVRWGLPVVVGTFVVLALVCCLYAWVTQRWSRPAPISTSAAADGVVWSRAQHATAIAATVAAVLLGAAAIAHGIGTPQTLNQTLDGSFHVNSIAAIAQQHLATPSVFSHLVNPDASPTFYPPTFAATGSFLVTYGGLGPIAAANVMGLAIAIMWPLSLSIIFRRFARPSALGYSIAMVGAVTLTLFPALLFGFGTLWPNSLSYLTTAPALVVLLRLFGLDRTSQGADDPHGRLSWRACLAAALVAIPGVALTHPGAVYVIFYLTLPLVIWWGWRRYARPLTARHTRVLKAVVVAILAAIPFVVVIWASYRIPAVASVREMRWPPRDSLATSIEHVLTLGTAISPRNLAMAVLVALGCWAGARSPRMRYLMVGGLMFATLAVMADAIQSNSTSRWTGFWYNDTFRLAAVLPILALPLIAVGGDWVGVKLHAVASKYVGSAGAVSALVVFAAVLASQIHVGIYQVPAMVASGYSQSLTPLVSPGEEAMFKRLRNELPPGDVIAGDPFAGVALAGVLSGHANVYPTFNAPSGEVRALVASKFNQYQSDPRVCAAVRQLRITVVVTGSVDMIGSVSDRAAFTGFEDLASVPGLTRIDSGGEAIAYRVGACRA